MNNETEITIKLNMLEILSLKIGFPCTHPNSVLCEKRIRMAMK